MAVGRPRTTVHRLSYTRLSTGFAPSGRSIMFMIESIG